MDFKEKAAVLKSLRDDGDRHIDLWYEALEKIGVIKYNYGDYMVTEPIDCNQELKRVVTADYELCCALLTMLFREDHFSNGSLQSRYTEGSITAILERMIVLLQSCDQKIK